MIETPRLLLRPYRPDDLDAYFAMTGDEEGMRSWGSAPMSREESWHRLMRYAGHWALFGFGAFAVFEKVSGRYLGETGLADFHRGHGADFDAAAEAFWVFARHSRGTGNGTEAAVAAHAWYDRTIGPVRTVCMISPANAASLNLAGKLGYRPFRQTVYRDDPIILLERMDAGQGSFALSPDA